MCSKSRGRPSTCRRGLQLNLWFLFFSKNGRTMCQRSSLKSRNFGPRVWTALRIRLARILVLAVFKKQPGQQIRTSEGAATYHTLYRFGLPIGTVAVILVAAAGGRPHVSVCRLERHKLFIGPSEGAAELNLECIDIIRIGPNRLSSA